VRVSAKADYAVRAVIALAGSDEGSPTKGEAVAAAQDIPLHFLENILGELRQQGLVHSRRGAEGGYWLARPADEITIAEVIRAVEGPLASVRGERPDDVSYKGDATPLRDVWIALRTNIRDVLDAVTIGDVVAGELPEPVADLVSRPRRFIA
jgi:Rrf2 family protein